MKWYFYYTARVPDPRKARFFVDSMFDVMRYFVLQGFGTNIKFSRMCSRTGPTDALVEREIGTVLSKYYRPHAIKKLYMVTPSYNT